MYCACAIGIRWGQRSWLIRFLAYSQLTIYTLKVCTLNCHVLQWLIFVVEFSQGIARQCTAHVQSEFDGAKVIACSASLGEAPQYVQVTV